MYDERARPPLLAGNRFLVLVASMVLELCGGSIYVTSLYKIEMRDRWGVSASDMDQLIKVGAKTDRPKTDLINLL